MKSRLLLFCFMLCFLKVSAQKKIKINYQSKSLVAVLSDLEQNFYIKFSYSTEIVDKQHISLKSDQASLQDVFSAIENQTNIYIVKETERYYFLKKQQPNLSPIQLLDEVVIKEYLTTGISKKKDGTIKFEPQKLGILPGLTEPDVLQSLQLLPGVQSPLESAAGLYINGGTPDQNLVLWDGIRMYHSGHFFGMISAFNPYITNSISYAINGVKSKYGNSVSGVIDITSHNDVPEDTEGGFGFNMTHADAFVKVPVNKQFSVMASVRRSFTDDVKTNTFKNLSKRVFQNTKITEGNKVFTDDEFTLTKDRFYFFDATLKVIYKPSSKDEIIVSSLFTENKLNYAFTIQEFDEKSTDKLDLSNRGISATWKHEYSANFFHEIRAYYSKFKIDYLGTNDYPDGGFNRTIKFNDINDKGIFFNSEWIINSDNILNFGYQFATNTAKYNLSYDSDIADNENFEEFDDKTNNSHAWYAECNASKFKNIDISLGLRTEYISLLNKFYLEPRILTQFQVTPFFKTKLSLEQRRQNISQIIEFNTQDFGLENSIWVLAEPDFVPLQKSNVLSFGANFKKNSWEIDASFYTRNTEGLTTLKQGFESENQEFFDQGESEISGVDVLVKKKINGYRTWLSYSTMRKKFKFYTINNGKRFNGNFHIAHQFYWAQSYDFNNFNISLGWQFRTGIPYTKGIGLDVDNTILFGAINAHRLPNYHRLDFSSTFKFTVSKQKKYKGKLGLSVINLYNRKSVLGRDYKVRLSSAGNEDYFLQEVEKSALGITPNVVFRLEF